MRTEKLVLGAIEIIGFSNGEILVDGGAMFGVVPRVIWEKMCPPDEANRVHLSLNSFLIRTPGALILAETGIGTLLKKRYLEAYGFRGGADIGPSLAALGFDPGEVNIVFNSHLHFDHCGGNTRKTDRGTIVPAFPKARYVLRKGEWMSALHSVERDRASYFPANLIPLQDSGRLDLREGDGPIAEGVDIVLTPGHTAFHQGLKVKAGGRTFFFLGDLVPTSAHIGLSFIMSYDLYPVESLKTRKKIYEEALAGNWILGFSHDPLRFFGRLQKRGGHYELGPLG